MRTRLGMDSNDRLRALLAGTFVFLLSASAAEADCRSAAGATGYRRPVEGPLGAGFGLRWHPLLGRLEWHPGLDFQVPFGTPVRAAQAGVIAAAGPEGNYGLRVVIDHGGTMATSYSHLNKINVRQGTCIRRGQIIGFTGNSGVSSGAHLHFEWLRQGQPADPTALFSGR